MLKNSYQSRFIRVQYLDIQKGMLGNPFIFDRKKRIYLSNDCQKKLISFSGGAITYPAYSSTPFAHREISNQYNAYSGPGGGSTHPLNTAYTAGSAGKGVLSRIQPYDSLTINKVYFNVSSYTGTAANVTDIEVTIRSGTVTTVDNTGPGLLGSGSVNPTHVNGEWNGVTGLSVAVSPGSYYWVIVSDASGNGTDYATVNYSVNNSYGFDTRSILGPHASYSTTDGAASLTSDNTSSAIIIFFSNGEIWGLSDFANSNPNGSQTRGMRVASGFPFDIVPRALMFYPNGTNTMSGGDIWLNSNGPSGTPYIQSVNYVNVLDSGAVRVGVAFASAALTIPANTPFRAVFNYSGANNTMAKHSAAPTGNADLRLALPDRGNIYWTEASGGSWLDDMDSIASLGLLIDEINIPGPVYALRTYPIPPTNRTFPRYGV